MLRDKKSQTLDKSLVYPRRRQDCGIETQLSLYMLRRHTAAELVVFGAVESSTNWAYGSVQIIAEVSKRKTHTGVI